MTSQFGTERSRCDTVAALLIESPSQWWKEGEPVQSELAFDPFALMDEQPESRLWAEIRLSFFGNTETVQPPPWHWLCEKSSKKSFAYAC